MTLDDAHTSHNHGFELPRAPQVAEHSDVRPWRVVAGVAVCLGLAGVVTGLIVARRQSVSDEHLLSDALQREELRDGWSALGAAAAREAQFNRAQASPAASAAAPPPNLVIVNVPAQSPTAAPPTVTTINLSNGPASVPTERSNPRPSDAPNMSLPPINLSPVPGYLPTSAGYTTPGSATPQTSPLPQYSDGTTAGSVPPFTPAVGNGSIPGSAPNPALPNNGLVGTPGLPGQPGSPGSQALPSGFSAP